ncbi:PAS domain S-box protein [Desulfobacula sp.]|uniref:PAS domain S-box protein n=1 Tax=Desulfobacula sp. TaxID=2593537 RepID=UPI0025BF6490|nr:PAS domain S-box protein [Desulfobacula sp.]MBC2706099.1 PAS domain S-box protein [Desulfobacula sp.]
MKNFILLKSKKILFSFMAIFLVTGAIARITFAEDSVIKIGILAKRGPERCMEKWSLTAEYLNDKISGKTFKIVPIDFDQIYSVVEKSEVDFILTNPSFYVELENYYGISRIATLKNKVSGKISTTYGGVVFCKKQRTDIRQYRDLKGKTFMAVEETSFGGWRMAWRELKDAGIDPFKDCASFSFGGTHDAVVYAVRDGKVDAGTVRTDTLERMNAEGKIRKDDFYVIHEHGGGNVHLPFLHSTREYPEWPISKLKHTANELAEKVSTALINMPRDSVAAQAARCGGWTIPLNYQPVHDCLKKLKVGPYKDFGKITLTNVFKKYWILILIVLATLVALACLLAARIKLNQKIKTAHKDLELEINERMQAEKALRKSEEEYRIIFKNTGTATSILEENMIISLVNDQFVDLSGYSHEEIEGQKKWIEFVVPEDLERMKERHRIRRVNGDASPKNYEFRFIDKNNHIKHILLTVDMIPGTKKSVASLLDITERKQTETALKKSEKQFRDLFNSITDLIYTQDMEGHFTSANPAMQRLFGYKADEFLGHRATDFMEPEFESGFNSRYLEVVKKQGHHEGVACYFKKNKEKIYIEYKSFLVKPDGGDPYISGIGRDVTETVLSEEKIKKLQEQVIQVQKMEAIGTLAGGIAHDFNNILFPILGYADMLLADIPEDSPIRDGLNGIYTSALRAKDLVKQILTFARQDTTELLLMKMQPIIKEVLKLIRSTIPTTIDIIQDIRADCGAIKADPTQIHQIVMNLATNAYHAMEETGGELKVSLKEIQLGEDDVIIPDLEPGDYACLSVSDTGTGMNKNIIEKIFDPFFTTKEVGKGTGMGLSVVHGIVKSMNGSIHVYSEPGKGTEFKTYFPIEKSSFEKQSIQTEEPVQGGTERILLVDDEEAIIAMEKQILERLGYQVTSRTSSIEALEAFRANPDTFDMVITDMAMPNMPGDKLSVELIKIRSDIPILLCTGFSEIMSEEKAASLGIKGFILKPIVMKDLAQKIRDVLDEA